MLAVKKENSDDLDGTRHFMVNVIEPQFNLHSEDANVSIKQQIFIFSFSVVSRSFFFFFFLINSYFWSLFILCSCKSI